MSSSFGVNPSGESEVPGPIRRAALGFAGLPAELKIPIWAQAILTEEESIQYELLLRAPRTGGATVRAVQQHDDGHDDEKRRRRRMRNFGFLGPEALTAVRETYVLLPGHEVRTYRLNGVLGKDPPTASSLYSAYGQPWVVRGCWVCPEVDRFSWLTSDRGLMPGLSGPPHRTETYPPTQDFLAYLRALDLDHEARRGAAAPGARGASRRFREAGHRALRAVRHLDMTLPALSGQKKHDMGRCLRAFPNLATVTISTDVPAPHGCELSGFSRLGTMRRRDWGRYLAENDPPLKACLWYELRRRFRALEPVLPRSSATPPTGEFYLSGARYGLLHRDVVFAVLKATSLYDMGGQDWRRFIELYRSLANRGVEVFIVPGQPFPLINNNIS